MRSKKAVLKNPDPALYVIFSIFIAFTHFSGCSFFSSSLTFCIYDISHCCQAGKKNIGWSCSEACVGCSWKSSALVVTRNKPKSPMLGTPACLNILTAGLKPPQQDLPAQILSKCSCISSLPFYMSSVSTSSCDSLLGSVTGSQLPPITQQIEVQSCKWSGTTGDPPTCLNGK